MALGFILYILVGAIYIFRFILHFYVHRFESGCTNDSGVFPTYIRSYMPRTGYPIGGSRPRWHCFRAVQLDWQPWYYATRFEAVALCCTVRGRGTLVHQFEASTIFPWIRPDEWSSLLLMRDEIDLFYDLHCMISPILYVWLMNRLGEMTHRIMI